MDRIEREIGLDRVRAATALPNRALDDVRNHRPELIRDDALAHLSPIGHAHINPNGRYRFDANGPPTGQLRPLRQRGPEDERASRPSPPILFNGDKH
ncbi:MAG: Tn3 transposase domain [Solirubrobacteraceae bacterium]|jgi:hypothetical protein|nr:Tn3 transposase domain [Solirubrobacteraceae bacterium]